MNKWKEISTVTIMGSNDGIHYELVDIVPLAETVEFNNDNAFKFYKFDISRVEDDE